MSENTTPNGVARESDPRYWRQGEPDLNAVVADLTGRRAARRLKATAVAVWSLTALAWAVLVTALGASDLGTGAVLAVGAGIGLAAVLATAFGVSSWSASKNPALGEPHWESVGATIAEVCDHTPWRVALLARLARIEPSAAADRAALAMEGAAALTRSESASLAAYRDGELSAPQLHACLERISTPLARKMDLRLRPEREDDWFSVTRGAHKPLLSAIDRLEGMGPGAPEALDALLDATTSMRLGLDELLGHVPGLTAWQHDQGGDYEVLRGLGADWSGDLAGLIEAASLVTSAE